MEIDERMAGYAQVTHEIFMHFQGCFHAIGWIRSGLARYAQGDRIRSSVFGQLKIEAPERIRPTGYAQVEPDTLRLEPDTLRWEPDTLR